MTLPIPAPDDCYRLWDEYHTPSNVRDHCVVVRDVGSYLGERLKARGEVVDLKLVEAGALLHDWLRFVGVVNIELKHFNVAPTYEDMEFWRNLNIRFAGQSHSAAAASELKLLGYPESLVEVVARHDFSMILDPDHCPRTWEEKLIFYADKRVAHDRIVTLPERFADGANRYPEYNHHPGHQLNLAAIYELEKQMFEVIGEKAEELGERMKSIKQQITSCK